jgi:hypothetical protein
VTETIIPGTYIDVRAEGLISAGRVATGIVAIVGTSSSGPVGRPVSLDTPTRARSSFGPPDSVADPEDGAHPLTLVRAIDLCYANGASTVVGVRVAGEGAAAATFALKADGGQTAAVLTAATPGTWANDVLVQVEDSDEDCLIEREVVPSPFDSVRFSPVVVSPRNRLHIKRGATGQAPSFEIVYRRLVSEEKVRRSAAGRYFLASTPIAPGLPSARVRVVDADGDVVETYSGDAIEYDATGAPTDGKVTVDSETGELVFAAAEVPDADADVIVTYAVDHDDPEPGQVRLTAWNGELDFADGEGPSQGSGDVLTVTYVVDRDRCFRVTLTSGTTRETFVAPDAETLAALVNKASRLVTAAVEEGQERRHLAAAQARMGTGSNVRGANGADTTADDYAAGLTAIENSLINLVVLAGQHAKSHGSVLRGHLSTTENAEHERIGIIGTTGESVDDLVGHNLSDDRVIVVAPGIRYDEAGYTLPAGYTAAAVAGLCASFTAQTSLTNKPINVPALERAFTRGDQAQLIRGNVLALVDKGGPRVLRGLTTEGEGMPYSAIPTRRIVDYARYGVRSAANPYLGRLNNTRVRDALKATLDGFLTRMVNDEALTAYELDVFADRSQEIRGEVSVVMTLQPMFSIEFILVTMFLR